MTDTAFSPIDDEAFAPGEQIQVISFLATDEELLLVLQRHRGALHKLFPEGETELPRAVENAVKRSLIARRALIEDEETGRLELLQPWAGLVEALAGGGRFCRLTTDGDDRTSELVLIGEDAVFTVARALSGIHTITISVLELAAATATALLVGEDDRNSLGTATQLAPFRLPGDDVVAGQLALEKGDEDRATRLLGDATAFFREITRTVRVETMEAADGIVQGSQFDLVHGGPFGWTHVVYAGDDTPDLLITPLTDDALATLMAEALAS